MSEKNSKLSARIVRDLVLGRKCVLLEKGVWLDQGWGREGEPRIIIVESGRRQKSDRPWAGEGAGGGRKRSARLPKANVVVVMRMRARVFPPNE